MNSTSIKGYTHEEYTAITDAFKRNFCDDEEIGAALCVYHYNQKVIDIWGGYKDHRKTEPWDENTVVPVFSTTKAIAASCLARCHSQGFFDYSDRVSEYWPAFAQNGKTDITIEQLLQHRAGLSAIDRRLGIKTIKDRPRLESWIAEQTPHWPPGEHQGYHVWNIGWYISALLSKIDPGKRRLKEFIETEIQPRIEGEVRIGLDEDYDWPKIATLKPFSKIKGLFSMPLPFVLELFKPWSLSFQSMLNPFFVSNHANFNRPEVLQLEIGAGGGVANARGLAALMDALNNRQHPLSLKERTLSYINGYPDPPTKGWEDVVFKQDAFRFHAGFMKPSERHDFASSKEAFGGFGAGGSFVFHDPFAKLTAAYTMNNMSSEMMNMDREVNLRKAVYDTAR